MRQLKSMVVLFAFVGMVNQLSAHCQIPCGIYDDDARLKELAEHVTTIRKSVTKILELEKAKDGNANQLVRWVMNKEDHADKISDVVLKYFLAQRIKKSQEHYEDKLKALHEIIVLSMKAKQTADLKVVDSLDKAVKAFGELYSHKH